MENRHCERNPKRSRKVLIFMKQNSHGTIPDGRPRSSFASFQGPNPTFAICGFFSIKPEKLITLSGFYSNLVYVVIWDGKTPSPLGEHFSILRDYGIQAWLT